MSMDRSGPEQAKGRRGWSRSSVQNWRWRDMPVTTASEHYASRFFGFVKRTVRAFAAIRLRTR